MVESADPKKWTYSCVLHARLPGKYSYSFWKVQYCSSTPQNRLSSWWWQRNRRPFKNCKSMKEILGKLTASWLKLRNLLMFTSYWWILEKEEFTSWEQKHRLTCCQILTVSLWKEHSYSLDSHFRGTLFCPGWANCSWRTPCLYSSLWSLNSWEERWWGASSKLQYLEALNFYQIKTNQHIFIGSN